MPLKPRKILLSARLATIVTHSAIVSLLRVVFLLWRDPLGRKSPSGKVHAKGSYSTKGRASAF